MDHNRPENPPLVAANGVSKVFPVRPGLYASGRRYIHAVDRVSLSVSAGEIVGLVGESGCGKTTLGRLLLRLETPTGGSIFFDGVDITRLRGRRLRGIRRGMQIIFQDPASSLNPRFTVRETLVEAILAHRRRPSNRDLNARLAALLQMVGISIATLDRYPREFSGGERQRVAIARALAVDPRFIVADEPISSLDLAHQAQIVALLEQLRKELDVSFLLISHDLDVVQRLCTRVAVMYLGRIFEIAPAKRLFDHPRHPYTQALMAATLSPDPDSQKRPLILPGDPPSPQDPPKGCTFHPRCPHAEAQCSALEPPLRKAAPNHFTKCYFDV
ncbi:MAG: ABC transporter ATP-binding protein [Myxococcota bacterium]|nr:ABC transporter ATP-binding protein [Myxococcota bacterium]